MSILDVLSSRYGSHVESKLRDYLTRRCPDEFRDVVLYQIATGGKRVRPLVTLLMAEACGLEFTKALPEACIVELIHEYSLIFDDIIDRSVVRRGKPTLWKNYGIITAILAGLWYREAIEEAILETRRPELTARLVANTIRDIIDGERLDILLEATGREDKYYQNYRFINRISSIDLEKTYLEMICRKTAALFRLSCVLGALAATGDLEHAYVKAAEKYGTAIGIAFQLIDDLLDIYGKFERFGKEIGKDLKEHKIGNAIVVYTLIRADPADREIILSTLSKESITEDDINRLIGIFDRYGTRSLVLEQARRYVEEACKAVSELPVKDRVNELIEIAKFIVEREF